MTYYNVFAPLRDPDVDAGVDAINGILESTYTAAGVPVADVAGAFHNGERRCRPSWCAPGPGSAATATSTPTPPATASSPKPSSNTSSHDHRSPT